MTSLPWMIYVRVSTVEQTNGVSPEAQLASCRAYAIARGWTVGDEVIEGGASAKTLNRDGMQRVLAALRDRRVAGVIAWRLDRLTRSVRDLLTLLDLVGDTGGVVSVTENLDTTSPMGRFVVHLLGSVAQLERENIAQRVSMAMQHAKRQGFWLGTSIPAGCEVVADGKRKRLAKTPEAEVVAGAWTAILAGRSLRDVAEDFKARGVRTTLKPNGTPRKWTPESVRHLLLSPQVVGLLVTADTQAAVRHALAGRTAPGRRGQDVLAGKRAEAPSFLAGLVRCPTCDAGMVQSTSTGASGGRYRSFRCSGKVKGLCEQRDQRCEPIEEEAVKVLPAAIAPGGVYAELLKADLVKARDNLEATRTERIRLTAERDQATGRIAHLTMGSQIGTTAWNEAMKTLGAAIDRIDHRLAELMGQEAAATIDVADLDAGIERMHAGACALATATPERRREVFQGFVQRVRITAENVMFELYRPEGMAPSGSTYKATGKYSQPHGLQTVRVRVPRSPVAVRSVRTRCDAHPLR
jgi:site-specific DNA recombinase